MKKIVTNEFGIPITVAETIGKKYGKLTSVKYFETYYIKGKKRHKILCLCDCGKEVIVDSNNLKRNHTQSCGCLNIELTKKANTKHNITKDMYGGWQSMVSRCHNPRNIKYKNYGGRGIFVCEGWRYNPSLFYSQMGDRPLGLTLERIDNNKGYNCGKCLFCLKNNYTLNVRWATRQEQERNKRTTRFFYYKGEGMIAEDWAKKFNFPSSPALYQRLSRGWEMEKALLTPLKKYRKNDDKFGC